MTTQHGEIYNWKSKVIAFVLNACMIIIANHFNIDVNSKTSASNLDLLFL